MNPVTVVGAGFSGLSLAYQLRKLGIDVRVVERQARAGGLIDTKTTAYGLVETAANAFICNREIEELFEDLNISFADRGPERTRRYIYWNGMRRWPLTFGTSVKLASSLLRIKLGNKRLRPLPFESVHDWSVRVVNDEFERRLLGPALQGIYAGDPRYMSATLALPIFREERAPQGKYRGSVSPSGGMNQLMQALAHRLEKEGVFINFEHDFKMDRQEESPVILCTSAWAAAQILKESYPSLADSLSQCESLPLVTVTTFFDHEKDEPRGFGCLFPIEKGFTARGVVFNDSVFHGRSSYRSETWIFGGAADPEVKDRTDAQIRESLLQDRSRLTGKTSLPLDMIITRWPRAIPHYTVQWEKVLADLKVPKPLFLHGNYLGAIGLSRIYQRSKHLAAQIKEIYGA